MFGLLAQCAGGVTLGRSVRGAEPMHGLEGPHMCGPIHRRMTLYQACSQPQCGQATVVETGALKSMPQLQV